MFRDSLDEEGLTYVELATEESNPASIRVIEANGGVLVERFTEPDAYGGGEGLRYRIDLLPRA
jgi:predicted acetyltransferase